MHGKKNIRFDASDLWSSFLDGNQEALGHIFQNYFQELYFYGLKIIPVPDIIKDVIQEMFIKYWDKRFRLNDVKNVKAYLLVTLRRELIERSKSIQFENLPEREQFDLFDISIEDFLIRKEEDLELRTSLVESLKKLTARQREVIFLRFYNHMDYDDLSQILKMNTQSVRNLLFRALEKIRADLQGLDIHNPNDLEIILFSFFSKK